MANGTGGSIYNAIDLTTKIVTALAIPIAGSFIDQRLKTQNAKLEEQKVAFQQALQLRDKNVDLTLKFYDIIGSPRFECIDEAHAPLLNVFIDMNNKFNEVKIDSAQIINVLASDSLKLEKCKASLDAATVVKTSGSIPTASSAGSGAGDSGGSPSTDQNRQFKQAAAQVARAYREDKPQGGAPDTAPKQVGAAGADGWVAVGRYNSNTGFTNFTVFGGFKSQADAKGGLPPDLILRARWAVYLRLTNTDTSRSENPILGVLSEGTCAKVMQSVPDLRGQTWALVDIQDSCPPGDYR